MAVQRGLQDHVVLVPDFDDSILIKTKINSFILYKDLTKKFNLPIISSSYNHTIVQIEFTIVYGSGCAFNEVGMAENSFHALELLTLAVEHSIFSLV